MLLFAAAGAARPAAASAAAASAAAASAAAASAAAARAAAASAAAAGGVCYHSSAAALTPGLLAIVLFISVLSAEFSSIFAVLCSFFSASIFPLLPFYATTPV